MSQPQAQAFPCKNCGAKMEYDAKTQQMGCAFCGYKQAVAAQPQVSVMDPAAIGAPPPMGPPVAMQHAGAIRDIPLEEGMRMAQKGLGVQVTTIQCKECGATVNIGQGERTTSCAFCGSKQVLGQETNQSAIRPESMVAFKIAKEEANKRFGEWLAGLWFRPSDLKKMASVQEMGGVYVPFWAFHANVFSQWNAERGWHYYVSETYTTTENNQRVTKTRQVQHTRWESASGARSDMYHDLLVCASKGLPSDLVDRFSTFDTTQLQPYQPEFLAGWRAESYAIELLPGWGIGQQKIATQQESKCGSDVGGDTHRYLNVANQFTNVTFKHLLLPVWIAAYRYNGKVFRFLVNGQTGEVVGKAPWSVWKIMTLILVILAIIVGSIVLYNKLHH